MAKKRSRQARTGSVYQSGGVWFAAVMVHGKRRRVLCESKADAFLKRQDLCQLAAASSDLTPSTFGSFRLRWLEHVKANHAIKTHEAYEYAVSQFSKLDTRPLERITGAMIQGVLNALTGRTRQQAFDKCKQMLMTAVKWKCLASNPAEHLDRPKHDRAAIDPFELSEVSAILTALESTRYYAAALLAFSCGLRGGELWGLQWGDWQDNELTVHRQACESAGTVEIKSPKTAAGVRRILLPDSAVEALQNKRARAMKDGHAGMPWIFPGETGSVTRRSNFGHRVWTPALKKLNIDPRGFHHARHTAATILLNSGVPLTVVSKTLGHASPAITLGIYAHVMTSDLQRHRNAFDAVISAG